MASQFGDTSASDSKAMLTKVFTSLPQELVDEVVRFTIGGNRIDLRVLDEEFRHRLTPYEKHPKELALALKEFMQLNTFRLSLANSMSCHIDDLDDEKNIRAPTESGYVLVSVKPDLSFELISFDHMRVQHLDVTIASTIKGGELRLVDPIINFDEDDAQELLGRLHEHFPQLKTINFAVDNFATFRPVQREYDIPDVGALYVDDPRCVDYVRMEVKLRMLHILVTVGALKFPDSVKKTVTFFHSKTDRSSTTFSGDSFVYTAPLNEPYYMSTAFNKARYIRVASMNCEIMGWPKDTMQSETHAWAGHDVTDEDVEKVVKQEQGWIDSTLMDQMLACPVAVVNFP